MEKDEDGEDGFKPKLSKFKILAVKKTPKGEELSREEIGESDFDMAQFGITDYK